MERPLIEGQDRGTLEEIVGRMVLRVLGEMRAQNIETTELQFVSHKGQEIRFFLGLPKPEQGQVVLA